MKRKEQIRWEEKGRGEKGRDGEKMTQQNCMRSRSQSYRKHPGEHVVIKLRKKKFREGGRGQMCQILLKDQGKTRKPPTGFRAIEIED